MSKSIEKNNFVFKYFIKSLFLLPFYAIWFIIYRFFLFLKREGFYFIILFGIFILFLLVRLRMFKYSINYPDEFNHILSGINLLEHSELPKLVNYTVTWKYTRGMPISFLVAVSMFFFGKTMFAAKLVPITLGTINFFMFSFISRKILNNKIIEILSLLTFSFLSWSIFNHFYIRVFVFIEFSFILMVFLSFLLLDSIEKDNILILILYFILSCALVYINLKYTNDFSRYLIPITFISMITFLSIFTILRKNNNISLILHKYISIKFIKTFIWLFIFIILLYSITNISFFKNLLKLFFNRTTNTGLNNINFFKYFFNINIFFTLLSILSLIYSICYKNNYSILLFCLILPMLFLHGLSSEGLQIMRGLLYIIPLYHLSSFIVLKYVIKLKYFILFFLIIFSCFTTLKNNYNIVFETNIPEIPSEIGGSDYNSTYKFLETKLKDYKIFIADYNIQYERFYNFKHDYKLDFLKTLNNHYTHYRDNNGIIRQIYTETEVINDFIFFKNLTKNTKCAVILKSYSDDYFLGKEAYKYIISNFKLLYHARGFRIYSN